MHEEIRGLTVDPILLQAPAYIAVVTGMTATFLVQKCDAHIIINHNNCKMALK